MHNYFNDYFDYGYVPLAFIVVVVLFNVWMEYKQKLQPYSRLFLPHPSLLGLSLIIAFVAIVWYHEQELLEELVAVFILFYSLRIYTCFHSEDLLIE